MTIPSLRDCVRHAIEMGMVTDVRVGRRLLRTLDAAQSALERGHPAQAVKLLTRLVALVDREAGRTIDAEHAKHMVMHARGVIDALKGTPAGHATGGGQRP